jgi:hypothetical protein
MPKKKVEQLTQTHGKSEKFVPTTLEQVWGDTGISKYKTMDLGAYSEFLASLNKSDLQAHAVKVSVLPTDNREMLTKKLITKFKEHVAAYRKPEQILSPSPVSSNALKILAEGR